MTVHASITIQDESGHSVKVEGSCHAYRQFRADAVRALAEQAIAMFWPAQLNPPARWVEFGDPKTEGEP